MKKQIEYSNGEITVIWQPHLCKHIGVCTHLLPQVYRPRERPWVNPMNATTGELIAQIEKCPSAALTYRYNSEEEK